MQNKFIGLTLGQDPHTVGIHKAGKIAKMAGIDYKILPPAMSDKEKICVLIEEDPEFIGLSYRLSAEKALLELEKFMLLIEASPLLVDNNRKICFAGLYPTLDAIRERKLDQTYGLYLMGSNKNVRIKTEETMDFFGVHSESKRGMIVARIVKEAEPEKIQLLDLLAQEVIKNDAYLLEKPLEKPSEAALIHFPKRIEESAIPLIRTHFGIPDETIEPTIQGIEKLALEGAVDEVSLGSSDLSQRYFGNEEAFLTHKNDGGVPYKNKEDLEKLYLASRRGNFPSVKPYSHVFQLKEFVDVCLDTGMLIGAHQAVSLFWFSQLDGRGPLSVRDAIYEHIDTVKYLATKGIPVEMNDPNQWSSRFIHDTLFVVDYALIAAVMFNNGVEDMIFQHQFNKPAETGDYADLAKMAAAKELIESIRPAGNTANTFMEARAGIEHFSTDLEVAKYQLARTTLLQMIFDPSVIHLVSYCEASHVATADDVIESSKIVRKAASVFKQHEADLKGYLEHDVVAQRKAFLVEEAKIVLKEIAKLSTHYFDSMTEREWFTCLSDPEALIGAMERKIMTAPGITLPQYANPDMLTKAGEYGFIDCYNDWNDDTPMREKERLKKLSRNLQNI